MVSVDHTDSIVTEDTERKPQKYWALHTAEEKEALPDEIGELKGYFREIKQREN